jgi:hypothetical protein
MSLLRGLKGPTKVRVRKVAMTLVDWVCVAASSSIRDVQRVEARGESVKEAEIQLEDYPKDVEAA